MTKYADLMGGDDSEIAVAQALAQLSVKGPMWSYEREWRIWRNKPCYFSYEFGQVKDVYFGVNCPLEIKTAVAKTLDGLGDDFMFREMEVRYSPLRLES